MPASGLHLHACICRPTSPACIWPTVHISVLASGLHLHACIWPTSGLHLAYIWPTSSLHLHAYIWPTSRWSGTGRICTCQRHMNLARGVQRAACQRAATCPLASATFWRGATSLGDLYESPVLSRLFDPILGVQSPACEFNPMRSSTRAASLCATRLSRGSLAQRGRLRSRASKLRTVTSLWGEHSAAELALRGQLDLCRAGLSRGIVAPVFAELLRSATRGSECWRFIVAPMGKPVE